MIGRFWNERTVRERILIAIAGALVLALVAAQGVIAPVLSARSAAQASYGAAQAGWSQVRQAAQAGAASDAEQSVNQRRGSLRSVVSASSGQFGLTINRVQPGEDGALSVTLDNAAAPQLYQWLHILDVEHGVDVRRASLRRSDRDIVVRATLTLAPRGG